LFLLKLTEMPITNSQWQGVQKETNVRIIENRTSVIRIRGMDAAKEDRYWGKRRRLDLN